MWRNELSRFTQGATLLLCGFSIATSIWFGVAVGTPAILSVMYLGAAISGAMLLVVNLGLVIIARANRLVHVALAILLAATSTFSWWSSGRHYENRHRNFVQVEIREYDRMAQLIMARQDLLTGQPRDLQDIIPRLYSASGKTNADGSVTIYFPGGEAGPRHGYMYHSGNLLSVKPGDPGEYFCHLTNGWYEY